MNELIYIYQHGEKIKTYHGGEKKNKSEYVQSNITQTHFKNQIKQYSVFLWVQV